MNNPVDYDALLKQSDHLTGTQMMALGDMAKHLGYIVFIYKLTPDDTRTILESLLDTQAALEGMVLESEPRKKKKESKK